MTDPLLHQLFASVVAERVDVALQHQYRCELADPKTGKAFSADERRRHLTLLFTEIAKGMGLDRFAETPVERLDQFAVMSVVKNQDTAGLLRSLVNSFMIAYSTPETSERAFRALLEIEALRAEVGHARGQNTPRPSMEAAAALDAFLCRQMPHHSMASPCFHILCGADRLIVMSPKPIKDLPTEMEGTLVEHRIGELRGMAH
jgi:hypothetical protein